MAILSESTLCDLPATTLQALICSGSISPTDLVRACLNRVASINPAVNAVVVLDTDGALDAAHHAEQALRDGRPVGALHGIPVLVKDTDDVAGMRTTYGSRLFAHHIPLQDLGAVNRLRKAGAIILGKTNTPEWAAGGNTRNPVYGATGNPFNPLYSAAGSSGGSAVALACGMAPLATGSDTGGSLRNPAAFNGIVGFRPSSGLVANERRVHGWSNFSTNGPMARTVADTALMLSVMASDDPCDPLAYSIPDEPIRAVPGRYIPLPTVDTGRLRMAYTEDFGFAPTERHVRRVFTTRVDALASLFASAEQAHPDCTGADFAFAVIRSSLFLATHGARYRNNPESLGTNIRENIQEGHAYTLEDYANAATIQTRISRSFVAFFKTRDLLISPAVTISPHPWREAYPAQIDGTPTRSYYHWLAMAYAATLAGCPAISIPMGVDEAGFPFGLQIVGPRGGDARLLAIAAAIETTFAGTPALCRPIPDLDALSTMPALSDSPGFRDDV
ncbi:amidase [Gluconacetobacter liquefaciens]|uniref:Amidase n=1 Tax=Gluconacetobacter liquefaciens TaxID=89584 RepID=A0A370FXE3_GLULI|nr:amidase [Gluconacetobacter liquefaciens]MBB2188006.1 amidase [Gluconacetobacter liquefaciens]RDI36307.1 Asp-tRNA(Asn)/Glu-tRNA(Gln) amidotransferase A subunit family amidase [Gluconacetobacter liquefaciens]GEB39500.1 amidase [Gluconacetobacter liquefaciens]